MMPCIWVYICLLFYIYIYTHIYIHTYTQTHVHWVSDAIQPSHPHPLSPPSPPAFNLSQYQGLFQQIKSLHQVAKVLELQLQHQFFQWLFSDLISFSIDWFDLLAVRGTHRSHLQHQKESINSLALRLLYDTTHICTWLVEKP